MLFAVHGCVMSVGPWGHCNTYTLYSVLCTSITVVGRVQHRLYYM
jgi:hypothetical protein